MSADPEDEPIQPGDLAFVAASALAVVALLAAVIVAAVWLLPVGV